MIRMHILGSPKLTGREGQQVGSILHQPKRLALFSYLALNSSGTLIRRDRLLGMFWPRSTEARARSSLSEALSRLRTSLGPDVVETRGQDEVGLNEGIVWCDAVELGRAMEREDWERVVELYAGPLLDGLVIGDLPEVDLWLEATRGRLKRMALDAAGRLADDAIRDGRPDALRRAEQALAIDPSDGDAAARVMRLLAHDGHRAAALSVFDGFAERLRAERDVDPAGSIVDLKVEILAGATPSGRVPPPTSQGGPTATTVDSGPAPDRGAPSWWIGALMLATAAAFSVGIFAARAPQTRSDQEVRRYSLALPPGEELSVRVVRPRISLSPDGARLLYVGDADPVTPTLWLRHRSELHAEHLPGTERATNPFFSPDGSRFGYVEGPGPVQKVMVGTFDGKPPVTLVSTGVGLAGATWSADGHIYYDGVTAGGTTGLMRVPAEGGAPEQVTVVDTASGELDHVWPSALPEGRGVLFTILRRDGPAAADVAVLDARAGETRVLVRAIGARFMRPEYLLFLRTDGTLAGLPFDLDRLQTVGSPTDVADGLAWRLNGAADLAVSENGTLVYGQGPQASAPAELAWLDRDGNADPVQPPWKGDFASLALSPDGQKVAISQLPATWFHVQDIFVRDLRSGATVKLVGDGLSQNFKPAWFPDGQTIAFLSDRSGNLGVYALRIDRAGGVKNILAAERPITDFALDPSASMLAYVSDGDIHLWEVGAPGIGRPLVWGPADEGMPALSPDARWLAYVSDESGRREVYVSLLDEPGAGRHLISAMGGSNPQWTREGRELVFESADGSFAVASLELGADGELRVASTLRIEPPAAGWRRNRGGGYSISPNGRRILTTLADTVFQGSQLTVNEGAPALLRTLAESR